MAKNPNTAAASSEYGEIVVTRKSISCMCMNMHLLSISYTCKCIHMHSASTLHFVLLIRMYILTHRTREWMYIVRVLAHILVIIWPMQISNSAMHVDIHTYMCVRTYVLTYIRTYIHTYIHTYVHTYTYTCMHDAYIHTYSHTVIYMCQ